MLARLSLLHITAPTDAGGLESVVRILAEGQLARGHTVHVAATLAPHDREPPLLEAIRTAGGGVSVIRLPARSYLRERAMVQALCRELAPSAAHTHGYRSDVIGGAAARRAGIPTVTTVHGFTGGGWKNRLYERLQRRAFRRFDGVVAVSRPLAELLANDGIPASRVHLLPNAYIGGTLLSRGEARRILGVPDDRVLVGWVGRLSEEKGPDVLIDALARLNDLALEVSLIGRGREFTALRERATRAGVAERLRFHGVVPGAERLYAAFDAFVLSSRTEGTPIVLFEAMAAGTPVVATRVGGVPDVVTAREALLVSPERPDELAAAIRSALSDRQAACTRAAAAKERLATQYSVGPWLDRYEMIYRSVSHSARRK